MNEQNDVRSSGKPSKVEEIKRASGHLRGRIVEELQAQTAQFTDDSVQLLKFHGMYQQDDRDLRAKLKKAGREKAYSLMIRARIPGGVLTAQQYLQFDRLADRFGNGSMRITTRQTFQLHGILKSNIKQTLQGIHDVLVTTLGGCGDQVRNILMCPAPRADGLHDELRPFLLRLVEALGARTGAYHEIWLDGEPVSMGERENEEPLYGDTYLPRKFKLAMAIEGDNCVDVYANDLGIVAHHDDGCLTGFSILVGGGMGRTVAKADTYPRLADPLAFIPPEQLVEVVTAIVTIQRDFGNRSDRRYSRFKYLLDERGLAWFREELERRLGYTLMPARPLKWLDTSDHLGWHRHGDDAWCLGVHVPNGRVVDRDGRRLKSALHTIVTRFAPMVRMTCEQNILFSGLSETAKEVVEDILREAGVPLVEEISSTVRHAMACVALPTCGLATAESERALPQVLQELEVLMADLGLGHEAISIRMTGCANGCARPYIGDIGFVGRSPGKYDLFLGGDFFGARLNACYAEMVPIDTFTQRLRPLFEAFKSERLGNERFGDYCYRVGPERLREAEVAFH